MNVPITREEAWELVLKCNKEKANLNHYLETEAIMKALALKLGEDEKVWGMLGLLHDIDWELTKADWSKHCINAVDILKENGFNDEFIEIIQSHGYGFEEIPALKDKSRSKKVEFALACSETLTGLIYAYALMRGGKISDMEVKGLKKKFKDKAFAANCKRDIIRECEKIGLSLDEFFQIAIDAVKSIKDEIGLS